MAIKNRLDSLEPAGASISAAEIKKWNENISQAKTPQEKTKIRSDFKKTYNINFSQKLMAEIIAKENSGTAEPVAPEPIKVAEPEIEKKQNFQTVVAEVKHAAIKLDDLVKTQKDAEDQEAAGVADPELAKAAGAIDAERDDAVAAADNALNDFIDPSLSHLSEEEREKIKVLDKEIENLSKSFIEKQRQLANPGLSPEERKLIDEEASSLDDKMLEIIKEKNEIKGIKTPEPTPDPAPNSEPTPNTEPNTEPKPEPKSEPRPEPNPGLNPEPNTEPNPSPDPDTTPETEKISNLAKFRKFCITEDELKNLPAFSNLSAGQQDIVYEGLKQLALVQIKSRARENVEENTRAKQKQLTTDNSFFKSCGTILSNVFNRVTSNLTKRYNIAKEEKNEAREAFGGGLDMHEESIEAMSNMLSALDVDVEIKDGTPSVVYLHPESFNNPAEDEKIKRFNAVANAFRDIPSDWSLETASEEENIRYTAVKADYETSKKEILETLKFAVGERNALIQVCKIDSQVKMLQTLASNPEADKELSHIVNQSAFKKMITGEVAARGSYAAGGFIARQTIAGVIGFGGGVPVALASIAAAPLAAAGIGAWRGRNQAKAALIEKDISGRKTDKKLSRTEIRREYYRNELKKIVPERYSVNPEEWLNDFATTEEKDKYWEALSNFQNANYRWEWDKEDNRDKTAKEFSDSVSLADKLNILADKVYSGEGSDEQFKNYLYSLQARIDFTEDKLADGLVNFGSDDSLQNKLGFTQALGRARLAVVYNERLLQEKEGQLAEEYKNNADISRDVKARFERLFDSKKIEFSKNLDAARKKQIVGAMMKGAGIGAAFALTGVIAREFAVQFGWLHNAHNTVLDHKTGANHGVHASGDAGTSLPGTKAVETASTGSAAANSADAASADINNTAGQAVKPSTSAPVAEAAAPSAAAPEAAGKIFSDEITSGDSVWRSTRELFKNNAAELGYEGDLSDVSALNKWAETQTANALHHTGKYADNVFAGNKILLEKNASGEMIIKVEAGSGAEPGFSEPVGSTSSDASAIENTETSGGETAGSIINKPEAAVTENIINPRAAEIGDPNEAAADAAAKSGIDSIDFKNIAKNCGFSIDPNDVFIEGHVVKIISNHQVHIDFNENYFDYEWNGETHRFTFNPDQAAGANIEKFLAERSQIERLAEGIQDNLMGGKIKSFSALQNRLEEMNGGARLSDNEKGMWQEIFQDNFGKKTSGLLDESSKFKILQSTMNVFLSGGAK